MDAIKITDFLLRVETYLDGAQEEGFILTHGKDKINLFSSYDDFLFDYKEESKEELAKIVQAKTVEIGDFLLRPKKYLKKARKKSILLSYGEGKMIEVSPFDKILFKDLDGLNEMLEDIRKRRELKK